MVKLCSACSKERAALRRPKTFEQVRGGGGNGGSQLPVL